MPNPLTSDQEDQSLPSPMSMQFKKLLESSKVGALTLKNRIVMPMINTKFGSDMGGIMERYRDYYVEKAKGEQGSSS